jgi:hypothetical protein
MPPDVADGKAEHQQVGHAAPELQAFIVGQVGGEEGGRQPLEGNPAGFGQLQNGDVRISV